MISLHEPQFDERDEAMVLETLRSTWVSTGGPCVDAFENQFAKYVGSKYAVSVCNGTAALELSLDTLARLKGFDQGFEVIVPTLSFIATSNAVVNAGGNPVFVDSKRNTLNICNEAVIETIRTKYAYKRENKRWYSNASQRPLLGVVPAHIMGWSCDISKLVDDCRALDLDVIEDAAESLGSLIDDSTHTGTLGIAGCFSFNGNKILTTGGGGMIVTNDETFYRRAKHIGSTAKTDGLRFVHDEVGNNFRLVNILAALGISQLEKLPQRLVRKKAIADLYSAEFSKTSIKVHCEEMARPNNWLVNIVLYDCGQRDVVLNALNENQIQARPLWTLTHRQPAYGNHPQKNERFPNAEYMWERVVSLPSSPQISDDSIRHIVGVARAAAKSLNL